MIDFFCQVPQQKNANDCGVYVLMYIEHFIKHAPNKMKTEYLTMVRVDCWLPLIFRKHLLILLIFNLDHLFQNFQFGEKCFGKEEVCALRRRIQSLIKEFLKISEDKVNKTRGKRKMDNNGETNEQVN